MADGDTPAVQQQRLRSELRKLRGIADFTQREVADALDWSVSKVIRIETGTSNIGITDLRAMLALYGVADRATIDDLEKAARIGRTRTWRDKYRKHVDPQFFAFLGYESSARRIRQFQSSAIPGLLQTEPYIRALSEVFYDDPHVFERAVNIRLDRQQIFKEQDNPPEMIFLLDFAVLLRQVGSNKIMRGQLNRIGEVAQLPNVTIRVVPFQTSGGHPGMQGASFTIFDFDSIGHGDDDGRDTVVFLEERHRDVMIRNNIDDISLYRRDFTAVEKQALAADETQNVLDEVMQKFIEP